MEEDQADALQVNIKRLEGYVFAVDGKIREIKSATLFGIWKDELTLLFTEILTNMKKDLEFYLTAGNQIMKNPEMNETREGFLELCEEANIAFGNVIHHIDNSISTGNRDSAIHEYISYVLRDLGLADKIKYYLCNSEILSTLALVKHWVSIFYGFAGFESTVKFLLGYQGRQVEGEDRTNDFFIITIPSLVIQRKEYWPTLVHELGHAILESYEMVNKIYPPQLRKNLRTDAGQAYYHSREYVSDYIANAYSGPGILDVLREYLYSPIVMVGEEHPPWKSRIYYLQRILNALNRNRVMIKQMPASPYESLTKLNEIIDTVNKKFKDKLIFKEDKKESERAISCLKSGIPFIGSPRILLNEYIEHKAELLTSVRATLLKRRIKKDLLEIERNLGTLVEESIRMSNMHRTYRLMTGQENTKE